MALRKQAREARSAVITAHLCKCLWLVDKPQQKGMSRGAAPGEDCMGLNPSSSTEWPYDLGKLLNVFVFQFPHVHSGECLVYDRHCIWVSFYHQE